jgi:hypothetical protein
MEGHRSTLSRDQCNSGTQTALLRTDPVALVIRGGVESSQRRALMCFFLQIRQPARLFECGFRCRVDVMC